MTILTDLEDPRVENVTVTRVEVAGDMRMAKIHVSVMGDDNKQKLAIRGLDSAAGYLQSKIIERIDTRYTPRLKFELDEGVKKSIAIAKTLAQVLPADKTDDEEPPAHDSAVQENEVQENTVQENGMQEDPAHEETNRQNN